MVVIYWSLYQGKLIITVQVIYEALVQIRYALNLCRESFSKTKKKYCAYFRKHVLGYTDMRSSIARKSVKTLRQVGVIRSWFRYAEARNENASLIFSKLGNRRQIDSL